MSLDSLLDELEPPGLSPKAARYCAFMIAANEASGPDLMRLWWRSAATVCDMSDAEFTDQHYLRRHP